ncbi:MAG: AbrB/MazE/SpoVT family DNA-binding domain-containing protein [Patescibacteria group bacterium]
MATPSSIKYVKSFSKGQITIPKELRQSLGMGDDFWLKLQIENGKLTAEPVEHAAPRKFSKEEYLKKILTLKTGWFNPQEITNMRKRTARRLKRMDRELAYALASRQDSKKNSLWQTYSSTRR